MMTDARLLQMLRTVGEDVQIYDKATPDTVIATIRGVFTKSFTQFDSDTTFNTQFEHTVESAYFVCRTLDLANVVTGHYLRLKKGAFQHRAGAAEKAVYRIMDPRHDGHGMTALVLHK